jgi:hypothetical protein
MRRSATRKRAARRWVHEARPRLENHGDHRRSWLFDRVPRLSRANSANATRAVVCRMMVLLWGALGEYNQAMDHGDAK